MQSYVDSQQLLQREYFTAHKDAEMHAAMDARRAELEAQGATQFHRTKIGRNATCPCGSGFKFKKCCLRKATVV